MALIPEAVTLLKSLLWQNPDWHVYAALDGASVPDLLDWLKGDEPPDWECLYRGDFEEPDLEAAVPYLAKLQRDAAFTGWLLSEGWGNHWGVFVITPVDLFNIRQHLRKFNIVYSPENKQWLFRYYDPRVLRIFLPTCDQGQILELFGPVTTFIAESEKAGQLLQFRLQNGVLQTHTLQLFEEK